MKKVFSGLILILFAATSVLAADTTYSTRKQKKEQKVKAPVNLYVPPVSQSNPQTMQGLYGQNFVPQVNFQPGGNSGVQINTPYFERQNDTSEITQPNGTSSINYLDNSSENPYETRY